MVIVGGSYAGLACAESLWDLFNVTVVDRNDYLQLTPAAVKFTVNADLAGNVCVPYSEIVAGNKSKFQFVQGTLTQVNKDNTIEISGP